MGADQSKGGEDAGKVGLADFDMVRLVGKGAFGRVWEVRKKDTGETFAMKELSKKSVIQQNLVEHTVTERNVMLLCENPFIINLYFAFQTEDKLYFVLDFVAGGSLFELFAKVEDGCLPEETVRLYAAEILLGIEELHQKGIVYRDMKLENILIGEDGHVVLTDFGLSAIVRDGKVHSFSGTAIYIAPEVLDDAGHGKSVDWWGYGVLLHVLLTGAPIFWSDNKKELFDMIKEKPVVIDDPILSPEAKDLITKLLDRNVKTRLGCGPTGAEELKKHPFFRTLNWKAVYKKKVKPALMPDRFEFRSAPGPAVDPDAPQAPMEYTPEARLQALKDRVHFQNFSFSYKLEPSADADATAASLGPVLRHSSEIRTSKSDTIEVASPQEVLSSTFSDDSVMLRKKRRKRSSTRVASLRLPNVGMFRHLEDPRKPRTGDHRRRIKSVNMSNGPATERGGSSLVPVPDIDDKKLSLLKTEASKDNRNRKFIAVGDSSTQAESLSLDLADVKPESSIKKRFAPLSARGNKGLAPRKHRRSRSTGTEDLAKIAKAEHGTQPEPAADAASATKAAADPKVATKCSRCEAPFKGLTHKRTCRKCRRPFCQKCLSKKRSAPNLGYTTPVRLCAGCKK